LKDWKKELDFNMLRWKIRKKPRLDDDLDIKEFTRTSVIRRNRRLDILKAFQLIDNNEVIFVERKGFVEGRKNYMMYLEYGVQNA